MKKEDAEYVTLARISRPWGNKGEVAAENLSGGLRQFEPGARLEVLLPNRSLLDLEVATSWEHMGRVILGFSGFATISDAERLRGGQVRCERSALEPLQAGEYYLDDLVGCRLVDAESGRDMGRVEEVYEPPGGVLLLAVVDESRREMLVPFANEICQQIDLESRRIRVRLPEGMEDLKA